MDTKTLEQRIADSLNNGITDRTVAEIMIACWCHPVTGNSAAFVYRPGADTIGEGFVDEIIEGIPGQDGCYVGLTVGCERLEAYFYPKSDLVILSDEEHQEALASMTVHGFFQWLDSIPNYYKFCTQSFDNRFSPEILALYTGFVRNGLSKR